MPCLAHYNSNYPNIITTDASTKGLGATLWQAQENGNLKPIGFSSRFLSDAEKNYAINELERLVVFSGLKHFRLYFIHIQKHDRIAHKSPSARAANQTQAFKQTIKRKGNRLAHFSINVSHIAGKQYSRIISTEIRPHYRKRMTPTTKNT